VNRRGSSRSFWPAWLCPRGNVGRRVVRASLRVVVVPGESISGRSGSAASDPVLGPARNFAHFVAVQRSPPNGLALRPLRSTPRKMADIATPAATRPSHAFFQATDDVRWLVLHRQDCVPWEVPSGQGYLPRRDSRLHSLKPTPRVFVFPV